MNERLCYLWGDNNKFVLQEIAWEDDNWINLARNRDVSSFFEQSKEHSGSIKLWKFVDCLRDYWLL